MYPGAKNPNLHAMARSGGPGKRMMGSEANSWKEGGVVEPAQSGPLYPARADREESNMILSQITPPAFIDLASSLPSPMTIAKLSSGRKRENSSLGRGNGGRQRYIPFCGTLVRLSLAQGLCAAREQDIAKGGHSSWVDRLIMVSQLGERHNCVWCSSCPLQRQTCYLTQFTPGFLIRSLWSELATM